ALNCSCICKYCFLVIFSKRNYFRHFRCSVSECASFVKSKCLQATSFFEMDSTFNEYSVTCCITDSCHNRNRCRDDQRSRTTYNKSGKPKVCPICPGSSYDEWW